MQINNQEISQEPINLWLNYFIKYYKFSSISIGIVDKKNRYTFSYGYYDQENKLEANESSNYLIASLSKIYTAIEVLKLMEQKKLAFQDPVIKYIPEFIDKTVTIKDLLVHTAGLPRDGDFNFWLDKNSPTEEELIKHLKKIKIINKGTYKYSNLGYAILGLILELNSVQISQKKISDFKSYNKWVFDKRNENIFIDLKSFTPSFGLYKNIVEMTELIQKLLNKDQSLLSKENFNEMFKVHLKIKGENEDDIAIPWEKWKGHNIYEFSGLGFGSASSILIDFDKDISYTVLINCSQESNGFYFVRALRNYINYCLENKIKIDWSSKLNGLYRNDDSDIMIFDCGDKIFTINPEDTTPFHPDYLSEYSKIDEFKYSILRKEEGYLNEFATFEVDNKEKATLFKLGGWGYRKVEFDSII
ncbi:MAG: serine hydrolase domain-containing protein [Candidatus Dojkabacteria bacterium]